VNTKGFGGRTVKKSILVYTNDKNLLKLSLKVTGEVKKFATITPTKVRLTGPAGAPLMTSVSIVPEKEYMFKVLSVEAKNGKFVDVELKDTSKGNDNSYKLIVKSKKESPGRYFDVLKLKTDSEIQPEIDVRVYGNILDPPDGKDLKRKTPGGTAQTKNKS